MKKFIRPLFLFPLLIALAACSSNKAQPLQQLYKDAGIEQVNRIVIQDGSTGYAKTIDDADQIDSFLSDIQDVQFTRQQNQEKRDGWRYSITLYDGESKFQLTTEQIGKTYYHTNPDILPIVDDLYKSLDLPEK